MNNPPAARPYRFTAGGFLVLEIDTMDLQPSRWSRSFPVLIALGITLAAVGPVPASGPPAPQVPLCSSSKPAQLWASALSWQGFVHFWSHFASRADRIVVIVLIVAAAALFIITRGKWL